MSPLGKLIMEAAQKSAKHGHRVQFEAYHLGARGICKVCRGHVRVSEKSGTIFGIITTDRCKGAANA